jgi:MoxR-like ATPase
VLRETVGAAANPTLRAAVEQAALQPASRVARLVEAARLCLAAPAEDAAQRVLAEALLREIDANFAAHSLPPELAAPRAQLASRLAHATP